MKPRKEDVMRLHALLYQVRIDLSAHGRGDAEIFYAYDAHGVLPQHVHRDSRAHTMAIFLLGEAISKIVAPTRPLLFLRDSASVATDARHDAALQRELDQVALSDHQRTA